MNLDDCRRFYSEEVRILANVTTPGLADAFAKVPRERFFGSEPWQITSPEQAFSGYITTNVVSDLYHNVLIAIDPKRHLNNGQPSALARWIDGICLKPGDRLFHVGCGTGYYTAIMAEVVGPGGTVVACDVDSDIAYRARQNLTSYLNVLVHSGDGAALDPGECDAMFINAGVTHPHQGWLKRLSEGGRLVLPLTASLPTAGFGSGVVARITRRKASFCANVFSHIAIYSCTSVRDPELEVTLSKALASRSLFKLTSLRLDPHAQDETCIVHSLKMCLSAKPCMEAN